MQHGCYICGDTFYASGCASHIFGKCNTHVVCDDWACQETHRTTQEYNDQKAAELCDEDGIMSDPQEWD